MRLPRNLISKYKPTARSPLIEELEGPVVDAHLVPPHEELHGRVHRHHRRRHLERDRSSRETNAKSQLKVRLGGLPPVFRVQFLPILILICAAPGYRFDAIQTSNPRSSPEKF